jgi:hypothetical protein
MERLSMGAFGMRSLRPWTLAFAVGASRNDERSGTMNFLGNGLVCEEAKGEATLVG